MPETGTYARRLLDAVEFVGSRPYGCTAKDLAGHLGCQKRSALIALRALRLAGWVESTSVQESEQGARGWFTGSTDEREFVWRIRPEWLLSMYDNEHVRRVIEMARPENKSA